MKIIIDDELLDRHNLTFDELLCLIVYDIEAGPETVRNLQDKGWLKDGVFSSNDRTRLADILNETKEEPSTEERIDKLCTSLMDIFPKGKKTGTPYYWRCNKKEVKEKLKKFFVYFEDTYTDKQILRAARQYVESFNGDYRFMRILKYFIWKNDRTGTTQGMSVEQISDLASYIENAGQENTNSDWTSDLI